MKHMITECDSFCLRNNGLAMLYRKPRVLLFQGNFAKNNQTWTTK